MPLNLAALTSSPGLPGAGGRDYPLTRELCAAEWGTAVGAYAAAIVPPSLTVSAAQASLQTALLAAFSSPFPGSLAQLELAFKTFATSVGLGMAPAFVAVPPVGPVGFSAAFAPPYAPSRAEAIARLASVIDTWMRTGLATMVAPPYTVLPWS